jgi:hypothetical protein
MITRWRCVWRRRRSPLSHRHDVGARQFPLPPTRFAPHDEPVIAEAAPSGEISQATSACDG